MELLRQDITMVKDDEVIIVEVTIPYETSNQYLEQRRQDKIRKYEKLLQEDRLLQVQCNKGMIVPITIGALGLLEQSQIAPIKIFINLNFRNKIWQCKTGSVNVKQDLSMYWIITFEERTLTDSMRNSSEETADPQIEIGKAYAEPTQQMLGHSTWLTQSVMKTEKADNRTWVRRKETIKQTKENKWKQMKTENNYCKWRI